MFDTLRKRIAAPTDSPQPKSTGSPNSNNSNSSSNSNNSNNSTGSASENGASTSSLEAQLQRYKKQLNSVVQAYKSLQREKDALEATLKVLTSTSDSGSAASSSSSSEPSSSQPSSSASSAAAAAATAATGPAPTSKQHASSRQDALSGADLSAGAADDGSAAGPMMGGSTNTLPAKEDQADGEDGSRQSDTAAARNDRADHAMGAAEGSEQPQPEQSEQSEHSEPSTESSEQSETDTSKLIHKHEAALGELRTQLAQADDKIKTLSRVINTISQEKANIEAGFKEDRKDLLASHRAALVDLQRESAELLESTKRSHTAEVQTLRSSLAEAQALVAQLQQQQQEQQQARQQHSQAPSIGIAEIARLEKERDALNAKLTASREATEATNALLVQERARSDLLAQQLAEAGAQNAYYNTGDRSRLESRIAEMTEIVAELESQHRSDVATAAQLRETISQLESRPFPAAEGWGDSGDLSTPPVRVVLSAVPVRAKRAPSAAKAVLQSQASEESTGSSPSPLSVIGDPLGVAEHQAAETPDSASPAKTPYPDSEEALSTPAPAPNNNSIASQAISAEFERYKTRAQAVLKGAKSREAALVKDVASLKQEVLHAKTALERASAEQLVYREQERVRFEQQLQAMSARLQQQQTEALLQRDELHEAREAETHAAMDQLQATVRANRERTIQVLAEKDGEVLQLRDTLRNISERFPDIVSQAMVRSQAQFLVSSGDEPNHAAPQFSTSNVNGSGRSTTSGGMPSSTGLNGTLSGDAPASNGRRHASDNTVLRDLVGRLADPNGRSHQQQQASQASGVELLLQQQQQQQQQQQTLFPFGEEEVARQAQLAADALLARSNSNNAIHHMDARSASSSHSDSSASVWPDSGAVSPPNSARVASEMNHLVHLATMQAKRDEELAAARRSRRELEERAAEVEERERKHLEQIQVLKDEIRRAERNDKRSNVNLEYLKNVVVRYMASPTAAAKQELVPVISAVLEMSPKERQATAIHSPFAAAAATPPQPPPPPLPHSLLQSFGNGTGGVNAVTVGVLLPFTLGVLDSEPFETAYEVTLGFLMALYDLQPLLSDAGLTVNPIIRDDQSTQSSSFIQGTALIETDDAIAVVGEVDSDLSLLLAGLGAKFRRPIISPVSGNPALTSATHYPTFVRGGINDNAHVAALCSAIDATGWDQVGIIASVDAFGLATYSAVSQCLRDLSAGERPDIQVMSSEFIPHTVTATTKLSIDETNDRIQRSGVRVIIFCGKPNVYDNYMNVSSQAAHDFFASTTFLVAHAVSTSSIGSTGGEYFPLPSPATVRALRDSFGTIPYSGVHLDTFATTRIAVMSQLANPYTQVNSWFAGSNIAIKPFQGLRYAPTYLLY
ncbi:hypothetical protein CAOG_09064, partial [Capsaspora owczarzaki ATCC 30864]